MGTQINRESASKGDCTLSDQSQIDAIPGFGVSFHSPKFRLFLVKKGSGIVSIQGRKYSAVAPSALCFNHNETPSVEYSDDWEVMALEFDPSRINGAFTLEALERSREDLSVTERLDYDYLSMFLTRDEGYSGYLPLSPSEAKRVFMLISSFASETRNMADNYWPCRSRSYILEIIFLLYKIYRNGVITRDHVIDDSPGGRIVHYINCEYHEKITIEGLCSRFNTNRTTLAKLVRAATGYSAIDYVNRTRVAGASLFLRDTTLPVEEIAYRNGFNDTAHFARIFRKFMKTSPGAYRKKLES